MDWSKIGIKLAEFGTDYQAAAEWVKETFEEEIWQTQMRRAKECESQLADCDEQLAEMREALEVCNGYFVSYAGPYGDGSGFPMFSEAWSAVMKALSAAPPGRRVLYSGDAQLYLDVIKSVAVTCLELPGEAGHIGTHDTTVEAIVWEVADGTGSNRPI